MDVFISLGGGYDLYFAICNDHTPGGLTGGWQRDGNKGREIGELIYWDLGPRKILLIIIIYILIFENQKLCIGPYRI